jgi:hypothetical protein
MERIFLSYTYNPHPDFAAETDRLQRAARVVAESLDLQVLDGIDLAGRAIDPEIERRIDEADGLVALFTPQADATGNPVTPPYVSDEYQFARTSGKNAIRLIHERLSPGGMGRNEEYIHLREGEELNAVLKLVRTLALWKRQAGRPVLVMIEPSDLGDRFRADAVGHVCQYQYLANYTYSGWERATIWPEPGSTYAHLPRVPRESKIKLRLAVDGEQWESQFCSPTGRIQLKRV